MNVGDRQLFREAYGRWCKPPAPDLRGRVADMLATRFDKQLELIADPSRRKAVLCTRRAGKTETGAAYLLKEASEKGTFNSVCVYVAPTLSRAESYMWKPLKQMNERFGFGGVVNETKHTMELPNGCTIRIDGADKVLDADKKRGDKAVMVMVDECGVYRPEVLRTLTEDVYEPALIDLQGTMVMMGTPGSTCAGIWWEMTRNETAERTPGWRFFHWSLFDNPHVPHARQEVAELRERNHWTDATPRYVREYLGRWVNDTGSLFYRYEEPRNTYDGTLPAGHSWRYVVGVDVGFNDAYADVVWAFAPTHTDLFQVECFKKSTLLPHQWAERIRQVREKYRPQAIKIDEGGLGKAFAEEMRQRHRIPVERADKKQKNTYVKLLNDDLMAGRVRVLADSELAAEWRVLPKSEDDPEKEDERFDNHAADAALYGWREARHFVGQALKTGPAVGSEEWLKAEAEKRERELEERVKRRQRDEAFGVDADDYWGASDAA